VNAGRRLRPARRVLVQPVGDGLTVLNLDTGQYYELEGTAATMWELLCDTESPAAAANILANRFGADPDRVARDMADFVSSLEAAGLMLQDNLQ
jgi:hypothetical protein